VFLSDALPLVPPPVSSFDRRAFEIISEELGVSIKGSPTSVVPEPATVALLGLGFLLSGGRRLRSRNPFHSVRRGSGRACPLEFLLVLATLIALSPAFAADCNNNGLSDECDLDCNALGGACNVSGCGTSVDCNINGILDEECELEECVPIDIVFLVDTSGSVSEFTEICDIRQGVLDELVAQGRTVTHETLAIGPADPPPSECACCMFAPLSMIRGKTRIGVQP
jgi:hypothetical protein